MCLERHSEGPRVMGEEAWCGAQEGRGGGEVDESDGLS